MKASQDTNAAICSKRSHCLGYQGLPIQKERKKNMPSLFWKDTSNQSLKLWQLDMRQENLYTLNIGASPDQSTAGEITVPFIDCLVNQVGGLHLILFVLPCQEVPILERMFKPWWCQRLDPAEQTARKFPKRVRGRQWQHPCLNHAFNKRADSLGL